MATLTPETRSVATMRKTVALTLLAGQAVVAGQSGPTLDTVLLRTEHYVADYAPRLSKVVAREDYVQTLHVRGRADDRRRRLQSDFLFLRLPGSQGWLGIREVLSVDGRRVESSVSRLGSLDASSPTHARALAAKLARENARHNLGGFLRTVNVPTVVVGWLHADLRRRLDFNHSGTETIGGLRVWRLDFRERERPTIIRTPDGADVVSSGRIWIDPETGRVWHTELRNTPGAMDATIRVRFGVSAQLGLLVPIWMRERYYDGAGTLETRATYRDFRQFDVSARIK